MKYLLFLRTDHDRHDDRAGGQYTTGHYLTVVPPDTTGHPYRLIFETDRAVVTTFRAGALPQVEYVEGCS